MTQQISPDQPGHTGRGHAWRFDRTLNVPTIVTVVGLFGGMISYANRVESKADEALREVRRIEGVQQAQASEAVQQTSALRSEIRADIRDLSQKIDQVMFRLGANDQMKGWTR